MHIISSPFETPAQLDSNEATAKVVLATTSGRGELVFFSESSNNQFWQVVESTTSENAAVSHREVIRFLDLGKHSVLPLWSLQPSRTTGWNVVILYDKIQLDYPLLNQEEAAKFQQIITGYKACKIYDGIHCGVISKSKRISIIARDQEDGGIGQLQLWEWPRPVTTIMSPTSPTNTSRSPISSLERDISVASTVRTVPGNRGGTSLQSTGGKELLVSSIAPPPVLVLFMQERNTYKIMKVDSMVLFSFSFYVEEFTDQLVTNLEFRLTETRLDLFQGGSRTFDLFRISTKKLENWNLCAMRPGMKHSEVEKLKCTYISLHFQKSALAGDFVDSMLKLQLLQRKFEHERATVKNSLYNSRLPTSFQTQTSVSPGPRTSLSPSFASLPHISHGGPLDDPLWQVDSESRQPCSPPQEVPLRQQCLELDTECEAQEIHTIETDQRFELSFQRNSIRTPSRF